MYNTVGHCYFPTDFSIQVLECNKQTPLCGSNHLVLLSDNKQEMVFNMVYTKEWVYGHGSVLDCGEPLTFLLVVIRIYASGMPELGTIVFSVTHEALE